MELDPRQYTIAWIAPLQIEARAAICMLDKRHVGRFPSQPGGDYVFQAGEVRGHNVVIAMLPAGQEYGTGSAAALASQLKTFFPNLWFGLLVGVAAGLPKLSGPSVRDIRLGDVLVAMPEENSSGLIAYGLGKETEELGYQPLRGGQVLAMTETIVRSAISHIKLHEPEEMSLFLPFYEQMKDKGHASGSFVYPGQELDIFHAIESSGATVVVDRACRPENMRTRVWYGPIGSADTLMKSLLEREKLRDKYGIIGIEMEAAGAMKCLPVGIIRGVCDYGDGYKNKVWQPYAAAMAAAYAKAILAQIGPRRGDGQAAKPTTRNFVDNLDGRSNNATEDVLPIKRHMMLFTDNITQQVDSQPYSRRCRGLTRGAAKLMQWPWSFKDSENLHPDIKFQIHILNCRRQCYLSYSDPFMRDSFQLEDARGQVRTIDFAYATTWEDLHIHILHIFPENHPGNVYIKAKRYLFHKANCDDDILWQDLGTQPLRTIVAPWERIRMTVIFPHQSSYNSKCPKCGKNRDTAFTGPVLSCSKACGLMLRFRDSYANEPDPLTKVALDRIKRDGRGALAAQFVTEARQATSQSGGNAGQTGLDFQSWLDNRVGQAIQPSSVGSKREGPNFGAFSRVTLCTPQWPSASRLYKHGRAVKKLSEIIEGLKRSIKVLQAENEHDPVALVASLLNSRCWFGRRNASLCRFLKSIVKAYETRQMAKLSPAAVSQRLSRQMEGTMAEFHPEVLQLRCLLWIGCEIFDMEALILRGCSDLLDPWTKMQFKESAGLFEKLISLPFAVPVVPFRVTLDLAMDIGKMFEEDKPNFAYAIRLLVSKSALISAQYYQNRNLDNFFQNNGRLDNDGQDNLHPACRSWLLRAVETGGLEITARYVTNNLDNMIFNGYL